MNNPQKEILLDVLTAQIEKELYGQLSRSTLDKLINDKEVLEVLQ
jgi:hypothetical protein